ncbi:alpha/beta hydrolase [Cernens ardua]|uniref:alpha/beta hydrolase n=1 Tax=Cernens ardua TaxID=3402176 RepID=UPI003F97AB62
MSKTGEPMEGRRTLLKWIAAGTAAAAVSNVGTVYADGVRQANDNLASWVNASQVSPEMHRVREILGQHFNALGAAKTLPEKRAILDRMFSSHVRIPADIHFTEVNEGGVKGEWSQGKNVRKGAVLYYLHGGGFSMGSVKAWRAVSAVIGNTANLKTFSLSYRLAPEHPFPAQLNDAVAGYKWLLGQGYKPENIIIAGDSAGGGLALSTVLRLKALHIGVPAGIYLLSPWTDMTLSGESMSHPLEYDPFNQKSDNAVNRQLYIGNRNPRDPYISPLFADFTGFPPILTQVGGNEAYLDDSLRMARRAMRQGVQVDVETWPNVFHVWQGWAPYLPSAREALADAAVFINQVLDKHH